MLLALAATEIEMIPLQRLLKDTASPILTLVSGVGPVESAVCLAGFLAGQRNGLISGIINFGVAGGYVRAGGEDVPALLDLYLAETEVFGDLGICYPDRIEPLPRELTGNPVYRLDRGLLERALEICADQEIRIKTGNFVTVAGVSATLCRGLGLSDQWQGQCENMEGAAIARVCSEFSMPMLELRCISNFVEDRNPKSWRLQEACEKAAWTVGEILKKI